MTAPLSPCCGSSVEGDYCSTCAKHIRVARIRELNDALRRSFIGRIVLTSGIASLGQPLVGRVSERVRAVEAFSADNDPHGEHDFGSFTLDGARVFFKIDYFEPISSERSK